jgi:hypothetical protein
VAIEAGAPPVDRDAPARNDAVVVGGHALRTSLAVAGSSDSRVGQLTASLLIAVDADMAAAGRLYISADLSIAALTPIHVASYELTRSRHSA